MSRTGDYGLDRFREIVERKAADGFFARGGPVVVTRAPGRLDLMGGIADYSGSLVLQYPIREATFAAVQISDERTIRVESIADAKILRAFAFEIGLDDLLPSGKLGSIADARRCFADVADDQWAAYAVGAFVVLSADLGLRFDRGARVLVHSDVPAGKGVSSSAALEVSIMMGAAALFGTGKRSDQVAAVSRPELSCRQLALLCQKVENEIVGAPCGVMDQMVSACALEHELVEILCQPAELLGTVRLPSNVEIWGIDSGIRHSVSGADYGTVRTAASMGYRIIAEMAGLSVKNAGAGRVRISDAKWNGYLANIDPEAFEATFASELPDSVNGREFLATFYGVSDPFVAIDPGRHYPVRAATAHPVRENARVRRFSKFIKADSPDLEELGSLMYASHESYSACGLGSDGTDLLVEMIKKAGPSSGLFGAKITGGGSGGTVAVLGRRGNGDAVAAIAREYEQHTGRTTKVFSGSSPGAYRFGSVVLDLQK